MNKVEGSGSVPANRAVKLDVDCLGRIIGLVGPVEEEFGTVSIPIHPSSQFSRVPVEAYKKPRKRLPFHLVGSMRGNLWFN